MEKGKKGSGPGAGTTWLNATTKERTKGKKEGKEALAFGGDGVCLCEAPGGKKKGKKRKKKKGPPTPPIDFPKPPFFYRDGEDEGGGEGEKNSHQGPLVQYFPFTFSPAQGRRGGGGGKKKKGGSVPAQHQPWALFVSFWPVEGRKKKRKGKKLTGWSSSLLRSRASASRQVGGGGRKRDDQPDRPRLPRLPCPYLP